MVVVVGCAWVCLCLLVVVVGRERLRLVGRGSGWLLRAGGRLVVYRV